MHPAWVELGLIDYQQAYALQTRLVTLCRGQAEKGYFLILEHPSVFTLGKRGGKQHLGVSTDFLNRQGIDLVHIERGGDITYHAPGQLVLYPIFSLRDKRISVSEYVSLLEEVMLRSAEDAGVSACRNERNHGIWVGDRKMGSIGIAIRHGVTFHGLALNVNIDLEPFSWINPCGLTDTKMTSLAQETGTPLDLKKVKFHLKKHLATLLDLQFEDTPLTELVATNA
ncbi:lipoyl(octanoyl) transferase LipB [Desulfogranum marinum]|uniref:lipoyl(octanoyl) transferase LipB n=1 Tax=Desulfogranum marinum TaxID=453220 RepID=UPI0029C6EE96|nr:lipoyl(octanoyl) transferase LipB [Desulfogranum marinum]